MSEDWETESSNFTNYRGTVVTSVFEINENSGDPELVWELMTDDPKFPTWTERFRVGKTVKGGGWSIEDEGGRIQALDGSTKVRDNSNLGKLIKKARTAAKIDATGKDSSGKQWGSTREAQTWVGSIWTMKEESGSFTNRETKEKVEWSRNFPGEFHGWDPGVAEIERQVAQSATPAAPASTAASGDLSSYEEVLGGLEADDLAKLMTLAKSTSPHNKFLDSALDQLPFVIGNARLMKELSKESGLYSALRES